MQTTLEAARIEPGAAEPLEQLASIYADAGTDHASAIAEEVVRRFPARDEGRYYRAAASQLYGRAAEADRMVRAPLATNPTQARGTISTAHLRERGGPPLRPSGVRTVNAPDPRDPSVYVKLGYLYLEDGKASMAAGSLPKRSPST